MALPEVPNFRPGFEIGDGPAVFNELIRDPLAALLSPPAFRARRTTALALTENLFTTIPWNQIDEDTHTGWIVGAPTAWTVPAGWRGWWHVTAAVSLSGTGATGLVLIPSLSIGGVSHTGVGSGGGWEGPEVFVSVGGPKVVSASWEVYAGAGVPLYLDLYYSAESSITAVDTTASLECRMELVWNGV